MLWASEIVAPNSLQLTRSESLSVSGCFYLTFIYYAIEAIAIESCVCVLALCCCYHWLYM